jgi:large subunit ribosomal protein L32
MAHPKRRISTTRRDKRRTHKKATAHQVAHWHEGKLYYRGKVVAEKESTVE